MENGAVFDFELFSNQMFTKLVTDRLILIYNTLRQSQDILRDHKKARLISQSRLGSIRQLMVHIINESFQQQVRELCESLPAPK
jgi:galactokinase/mevalonate kinase-like predicted kinase